MLPPTPPHHCPMHPDQGADGPGTCPRCGKELVPDQAPAQRGTAAAQPADDGRQRDMTAMVREMRRPWLWTNASLVVLGIWLVTCPGTFGYGGAMAWSDAISGLLLALLAGAACSPALDFWCRWGASFVGVWLLAAPLLLWAAQPAAYAIDTLVGAWAIALTILVPMMPGMAHHHAMQRPGPEIPPGWTFNPSAWVQRAPLIALALAGWLLSRYLAAVELGYIPAAWEPFFGRGTDHVLHSAVSRMWPVSDAGLGALAYTFELLMSFMGGETRWRSMPWMVVLFGIMIVPLGLTHILLVVVQPVVVGDWCTLCLAAAAVMLVMIPLMLDEVVAMLQFMAAARREGKPFWRTFWVGDTIAGGMADTRTPRYGAPMLQLAKASGWGMSAPWNLVTSAALGVWLMSAPSLLGASGAAADSDHLGGALAVTVAVIAMAEVVRTGRYINLLLGCWIAVAPFILPGATTASLASDLIAGIALAACSLPRGRIVERYGAWSLRIR